MEENFLADKPISEEKDDKFQRYFFSKRIAETILNRTSTDSIVIGLYGAWGEGKTSVLNFIKQELKPHQSDIIYFTFNPWRFTDEAALLTTFFNTLANELKKSLVDNINETSLNSTKVSEEKTSWWERKKGPLKTNSEAIGELMQEYGKIVSIFRAGEAAEAIGKAISNVNIETLKERIEKLLSENKKRIIIFIDDIDRLEKDEIHAIFRLVKLTGDFAFTTYLLSFDENMVSSAIGERFGGGDQKAGLNFLEKIIQIPIKLPLAQKTALKNYCFNLVEQSLDSCQIVLSEKEAQEFVRKFTSNFLIRLTTPRLAVRYGNSLSFALPLLKGEVNYVDLLLIEAIRVFYPELYDFARIQPDYFIGKYKDTTYPPKNDSIKIDKFKKIFEDKTINYSLDEIANAKGALQDLFPTLDSVWPQEWNWGSGTPESLYNERRISTYQYFNRYFSYTVIAGDISDVAFASLLENISYGDYLDKIEPTKKLISSATPDNFIEKIRYKEKTFDNSTSISIVKVFSQLGDSFPENSTAFYSWLTPNSQAAIFLAQLIRNQIVDNKKFDTIEWVIDNAIPFKFAYQIFNYCRGDNDEIKKLFDDQQYIELGRKLIERAKKLAEDAPIWEIFTFESKYMLGAWAEMDNQEFTQYVHQNLEKKPSSIIDLLKVFVGLIHSSAYPTPYLGPFRKESYQWLAKILDADYIFEKVAQSSGINLLSIDNYEDLDHNQTDENIIKQFAYWHNQNKNTSFTKPLS